MSTTHKQLQNILANELGVTRATVEAVIRERVEQLLKTQPIEKWIREQVSKTLQAMSTASRYDQFALQSLVSKEAEKMIRDRLRVSFAPVAQLPVTPDDDFPF